MNDPNQNSFFDIRTLLAIATVLVFWFVWDSRMKSRYPEAYKTSSQQVEQKADATKIAFDGSKETKKSLSVEKASALTVSKKVQKDREKLYLFEDKNWSFLISNKGMGLQDISLKQYKSRSGESIGLAFSRGFRAFETQLKGVDKYLYFRVKRVSPAVFRGKAKVNDLRITKTLTIDSENFLIEVHVLVENVSPSFKGFLTYLSEKEDESLEEPSIFSPVLAHQELFVNYENDFERVAFSDVKESSGQFKNVNIVSIGAQYFNLAFVNRSDVLPKLEYFFDLSSKSLIAQLEHRMLNRNESFEIKYSAYAGPKDLKKLAKVSPQMTEIVDFGWFGSIARGLLSVLSFLESLVGNWGVAIIILTFLVRLILLPLNIVSYKSMRNMQKVQPLIKATREKYKDEPQRMNKEVMSIMKENKANPMAGCLPMFLQFPIFIALYRVLGMSIELYQAPFAFWIQDLSLKDDLYILPVLMGVAMFFQMKLSPSTGDSTQKKIMMFMPIMFTFFMLNLPSGLTLYMLTTTLFGIVQHFVFMKDKPA